MKPYQRIHICGTKTSHSTKFAVKLKPDSNNDDNINLIFDIRFADKAIVCNDRALGQWGGERRDGDFIDLANGDFDMIIIATENSFEFELNGHPYPAFNYRLPLEMVRYIDVVTDFEIHSITKEKQAKCK